MKNIGYIFIFTFLFSCTSNTIFEKPKDLIPKDTMCLLIQEMAIASSSKYIKNKNLEKNIEYMPLVFDRFQIDSIRFQTSNLYYMSKIDVYQEIFIDAKTNLEKQKKFFEQVKKQKDSLRKDSISKIRNFKRSKLPTDTISKDLKLNHKLKGAKPTI